MGLLQREAAERIGVNVWTLLNWEKGRTEPAVSAMPGIFQFLGYDPFPEPRTLPDRLRAKRREMGWSIEHAAKYACVDPGTWANWEHGTPILYRQHRARIAKMLGLSFDAVEEEIAARWIRSHGGDQ